MECCWRHEAIADLLKNLSALFAEGEGVMPRLTKDACSVRVLDAERNLEPLETPDVSGSTLKLTVPAGSAAFLVEVTPG